jgi:hypothetical protein
MRLESKGRIFKNKPQSNKVSFHYNGEFGFELVMVLPRIRTLVRQGKKVTLENFPSSFGLYGGLKIKLMDNHEVGRRSCLGNSLPQNFKDIVPTHEILRPDISPKKDLNHICVHMRNLTMENLKVFKNKRKMFRNWDPHHNELIEFLVGEGYRITFIGIPNESLALPDLGNDCRGCDIEETIRLLKSSILLISPSSGPVHLAQMCGVPCFSWKFADKRFLAVPRGISLEWNALQTRFYHPWSWKRRITKLFFRKKYRRYPSNEILLDGLRYALDQEKRILT